MNSEYGSAVRLYFIQRSNYRLSFSREETPETKPTFARFVEELRAQTPAPTIFSGGNPTGTGEERCSIKTVSRCNLL